MPLSDPRASRCPQGLPGEDPRTPSRHEKRLAQKRYPVRQNVADPGSKSGVCRDLMRRMAKVRQTVCNSCPDVGVQEWKVVRRRNSAFSEREREETVVPAGMTASV